MAELEELEARLGLQFGDRQLLRRAFTHHSCCPATTTQDSYDTLEFLGDAIIGMHVVEHIYRTFAESSEGQMTALKSEVVSRRILGQIGMGLGLFDYIQVDVPSLRTFNERSRLSLVADVLESLVGAIHIDQGWAAAQAFVQSHILAVVPQVKETLLTNNNPKGRLQQVLLRRSGRLPRYEVLEESGQSNDRAYLVGVYDQGILLATGRATSIKEAGRLAAMVAVQVIAVLPDEPGAPLEAVPTVSAEERPVTLLQKEPTTPPAPENAQIAEERPVTRFQEKTTMQADPANSQTWEECPVTLLQKEPTTPPDPANSQTGEECPVTLLQEDPTTPPAPANAQTEEERPATLFQEGEPTAHPALANSQTGEERPATLFQEEETSTQPDPANFQTEEERPVTMSQEEDPSTYPAPANAQRGEEHPITLFQGEPTAHPAPANFPAQPITITGEP